MKALIVYHSKSGHTKSYAEKIGRYIETLNGSASVRSIHEVTMDEISASDLLFLGCWTSGMFIFGQNPDKDWVEFVNKLPQLDNKKTILFTTFLIATGSMFRKMKDQITSKGYKVIGSMKSNNGKMDYYSFVTLKYALNHNNPVADSKIIRKKEKVLEVAPVL